MLIVIALVPALVIPISGSADRGLHKETPIPITATQTPTPVVAQATPTPVTGDDIVCFDLSTVDEAVGSFGPSDVLCVDMSQVRGGVPDSREVFERLGTSSVFETVALEDFRGELLDILDELDELSAELPSGYPRLRDIQSSLKTERKRIQELTDEELHIAQSAFTDYKVVKASLESVKSLVRASKKASAEADQGLGSSLNSFTIIPTPTPVTSPPPGIEHTGAARDAINQTTGDLFPPAWPTDVACPEQGYPPAVMFGMMIGIQIGRAAEVVTQVMCSEKTATCPGVNIQDPPTCWVYVAIHTITNIVEDVRDGFAFCNGNVIAARIEALYHDTEIIHADLDDHDQNLTTRFNWMDKFLFDFRNLNLRLNIEANLASPDDDPHALLALPRAVCISTELEALQLTDPFASEVIAGCGLLEVVSDTVRSAMDMTLNAGEGINNAEAEFDAAVAHYNNGEWKLAYARFRKAYREAVRP
jgi:hypothetical protein